MKEDEMAGWHYCLYGPDFEQALRVGDGQESLACCRHGVTKSQTQLRTGNTCTAQLRMNKQKITVEGSKEERSLKDSMPDPEKT